MSPAQIVLLFLERINQRNPDALAKLMSPEHLFIDSLGQQVRGREKMRAGWRGYYALCPDYWVSHDEFFESGSRVAVFGTAGGTIAVKGELLPENQWQIPAAWLAVVEEGLISEWRVYADNKPVFEILAKAKG